MAKVVGTAGELKGIAEVARFALGGKAILTLENAETGARYTYRLRRAKPRNGQAPERAPIFVQVLTGPNNQSDYTYLGQVWTDGATPRYQHGQKSRIGEDAPSAKGAAWLFGRIVEGRELPAKAKVWHDGCCARCRRALTVPSSVATGFGPECASIVGAA